MTLETPSTYPYAWGGHKRQDWGSTAIHDYVVWFVDLYVAAALVENWYWPTLWELWQCFIFPDGLARRSWLLDIWLGQWKGCQQSRWDNYV
jgi:hypothetical protein